MAIRWCGLPQQLKSTDVVYCSVAAAQIPAVSYYIWPSGPTDRWAGNALTAQGLVLLRQQLQHCSCVTCMQLCRRPSITAVVCIYIYKYKYTSERCDVCDINDWSSCIHSVSSLPAWHWFSRPMYTSARPSWSLYLATGNMAQPVNCGFNVLAAAVDSSSHISMGRLCRLQ